MSDQAEAGSVAAVVQPAGNLEKPAAAVDNGSATEGVKSWFDGLSEGNRKIAETKGWNKSDSADVVLTSYAELEKQQGESLRVPAADAPKEEWEKFHSRLPEDMRPITSPDKVEYKRPEGLPENLPYSDELATASKAWAAEAGATPKVAQAYHDKFLGYMTAQASAQQAAVAQSVEATHDDLVKDWGPKDSDGFKQKLELANRAAKKLDLVDAFKEAGILLPDGSLTKSKVARALQAVGEGMFKEDTIEHDAARGGGDNPFKRDAKGERNLTAISALVKSDPERAKRLCKDAGENPDSWFPSNPN
ncbi:hypothetical protein NKH47_01825 [Mesorhizobium sp. M1060]|uniref:hypothetical protein n=1 Tax=Mesorhizobium sp. M1060 TaxID=2957052 RepID=UPI00333CA18E